MSKNFRLHVIIFRRVYENNDIKEGRRFGLDYLVVWELGKHWNLAERENISRFSPTAQLSWVGNLLEIEVFNALAIRNKVHFE